MTNEDSHEKTGVDNLRDEMKSELLRAAHAREKRHRARRRRLGFSIAAVMAVAIPGTIAVAGLMPEGDEMLREDATLVPAPPPMFSPSGAYPDCPHEVQERVIELDPDDYAQSPGYPVAGCPTVEALEELRPSFDETLDDLAGPGGPLEGCPPEVLDALREDEHLSEYTVDPVVGCPADLLPTSDAPGGEGRPQELELETSPKR